MTEAPIKKAEFEQKGFAVIPEVFTPSEVIELRAILDAFCAKYDQNKPIHAS